PALVIVRAVPPSLSAPRVSCPAPAPLLATVNVAAPFRVVVPRVRLYAESVSDPVSACTVRADPDPIVRAPIANVVTPVATFGVIVAATVSGRTMAFVYVLIGGEEVPVRL